MRHRTEYSFFYENVELPTNVGAALEQKRCDRRLSISAGAIKHV